jgi:hypothetical protein
VVCNDRTDQWWISAPADPSLGPASKWEDGKPPDHPATLQTKTMTLPLANGFSRGKGREWLEFDLGKVENICSRSNRRVSAVGVKIPPLPHGPLSVRRFFVEYIKQGESKWKACTDLLETIDVQNMQRFALCPPVDATRLRVVMTMSALGSMIERSKLKEEEIALSPDDCCGLFEVKFW